jgi:hypothetical protein
VKVNPLTVLIAILVAVELAGILGALLAIPVAGIIQIIARDIWDTRRGRLKSEPTVGEDQTPIDSGTPPAAPSPAAPPSAVPSSAVPSSAVPSSAVPSSATPPAPA